MTRLALALGLVLAAVAGADDPVRTSATGAKIAPGVAVATFRVW